MPRSQYGPSLTQDSSTNVNDIGTNTQAYQDFKAKHPGVLEAFAATQPGITSGWASWKPFVIAALGVLGGAVGANYLLGLSSAASDAAASSTVASMLGGTSAAGAGTAAGVAGVEGGAYGVGAGTVAALGGGAMAGVPVAAGVGAGAAGAAGAGAAAGAAGTGGAGSAVGGGAGASVYGPAMGGAAQSGFGVGDALKYGLPIAGNVVSSLIQANAAGKASDAQQRYLEEALAYQKEQDAYNRQFAQNRVNLEAGRYATYAGNIEPYLQTGGAANDRMAALLGLPAGSGSTGGGRMAPRGAPDQTGDWQTWFQSLTGGKPPTPAQLVALEPLITASGAKVLRNAAGVAGKIQLPGGPIVDVIQGAGSGGQAWQWLTGSTGQTAGPRTTAPMPTSATPATPAAPGPQAPAQTQGAPVMLKAPDGSTKQVPASQLSYWLGKGAQQVTA